MKAREKEWSPTAQTVDTVLRPFLKQVLCPLTRNQRAEIHLHLAKKQLLPHPTELLEVIQLMHHHHHHPTLDEIQLHLLGKNSK